MSLDLPQGWVRARYLGRIRKGAASVKIEAHGWSWDSESGHGEVTWLTGDDSVRRTMLEAMRQAEAARAPGEGRKMSNDTHPTLYAITNDVGTYVSDPFDRDESERCAAQNPVPSRVIAYVSASEADALRAEVERLRSVIDAATVTGATTVATCGAGEPPCKRVPGHADDHMGLAGEAMAADLADARAEVEALRRELDAQITAKMETAGLLGNALADVAALTARAEKAEAALAMGQHVTGLLEAQVEAATARAEKAEAERDEWKPDPATELSGEPDWSSVEVLVRWVKEQKARPNYLFDTAFRAVSEGGTVWFFDPEEIEKLWDDRDAAENRAEKAERATHKIAEAMRCEPDDADDLVEAVRLCVAEREASVAHAAALEAALARIHSYADPAQHAGMHPHERAAKVEEESRDALSGGTAALDAHDAARDAEVRKRVEGLTRYAVDGWNDTLEPHAEGEALKRADVLAAIDGGWR